MAFQWQVIRSVQVRNSRGLKDQRDLNTECKLRTFSEIQNCPGKCLPQPVKFRTLLRTGSGQALKTEPSDNRTLGSLTMKIRIPD